MSFRIGIMHCPNENDTVVTFQVLKLGVYQHSGFCGLQQRGFKRQIIAEKTLKFEAHKLYGEFARENVSDIVNYGNISNLPTKGSCLFHSNNNDKMYFQQCTKIIDMRVDIRQNKQN